MPATSRALPSDRAARVLAFACFCGLLITAEPAAGQYELLHTFSGAGGSPRGGLVVAPDGTLYGTAANGGRWGLGSVFRLSPQPDGSFALTTIASFDGNSGAAPAGAPIIGADGALYGTTEWSGLGTIYRLTVDGHLSVLHRFVSTEGAHPTASLLRASDGFFYGTAPGGGSSLTCTGCGTLFRISAGGVFAVLHAFNGTDGAHPSASLIEGADGHFYGTTVDGGENGRGTVFRLTKEGALTTIHHFAVSEGKNPNGLLQRDGTLYGTTRFGGANNGGTLFAMDTGGNMLGEWPFSAATGTHPEAGLLAHPDGSLYGTARFAGAVRGTVFRFSGGIISSVHAFTISDGAEPVSAPAMDAGGVLYGTTTRGGASGEGTVFRLALPGAFRTLAEFGFRDGAHPFSGLTAGGDGAFYGVTPDGGSGSGTVFRIDGTGSFGVVHRFSLAGIEGMLPNAEMVAGLDGALYGTTHGGGAGSSGVVFKVDPAGAVTVVHHFTGIDGSMPRRLTRASDGSLYGTTVRGGTQDQGTIFRIAIDGTFTTLHSFTQPSPLGATGGTVPAEGVTEGADGLLYGTTLSGGANDAGVIFRLDPASGSVTTVYSFPQMVPYDTRRQLFRASTGTMYLTTWDTAVASVCRLESNGTLAPVGVLSGPSALIEGRDGLFYGVSHNGGTANAGTIFQLHPDGSLNILHSFSDNDRGGPSGRLLQATDGTFYGTTHGGGETAGGTVFRIAALATSLSVPSITRPYRGSTALTAMLSAGGTALAGKTVAFRLNGHAIGTARTDAAGVAVLDAVQLGALDVGLYPDGIAADFSGDDGFLPASGAGFLTIVPATPSLSWNAPAPIPYGTPLGSTQLNASASVPGTFNYVPGAGSVLTAGVNGMTTQTHVLSVVFTPNDEFRYTQATASVTIQVVGRPTVSALTPDLALPAAIGSTITWTASAAGGLAPLQYQFWRLDGGAWTMVRDYEPVTSYSWTPGPGDVGTHALQVWVRSTGSAARYDAWVSTNFFTITGPEPVAISSLASTVAFPARAGYPITWMASATGGTGPLFYKFWLYCASTGAWTVAQDYSVANGFTMTPMQGDTCAVQVWVRSFGSTATYEAWKSSGMFEIAPIAPVAIASLVPNVPPPFLAGVPIRWTAVATGGVAALQYKFWLYRSTTNAWTVLQDYSVRDSVTYTPMVGETQAIQVWVRSAGSAAEHEAWRSSGTFTVTGRPTVRITSLTPTPWYPFSAGVPVNWTATTTEGIPPIEYKFWLYQGGAWTVLRDYSTHSSVVWTPPAAGRYAVQVWVRNTGSTAPYEAWETSGFFEVGPSVAPVVTSLTSDFAPPFLMGTPVTWTAVAQGGFAPLEYKFWLYEQTTNRWVVLKEYSVPNLVTWSPAAPGRYALQVWVRSAGSTNSYDAWRGTPFFDVAAAPVSVSALTPDVSLPVSPGTTMTWTATATGGVAPLEYQFSLQFADILTRVVLQEYSPSAQFRWTPTAAGQFQIWVKVRSAGSTAEHEAFLGTGFFSVQYP